MGESETPYIQSRAKLLTIHGAAAIAIKGSKDLQPRSSGIGEAAIKENPYILPILDVLLVIRLACATIRQNTD